MTENLLHLDQAADLSIEFKSSLPPREPEPRKELNEITICVMILANGFKVVGVNEGSVSPKNFDADTGKRLARQKAIDQIWAFEGYLLKQKLNDS